MAKQFGHLGTITFGGTSLGCIQSIDITEDIDNAMSNCMGTSHKVPYTGNEETSITVAIELETDDVVLWGTTLARGTTGAVVYLPFGPGTGNLQIDGGAQSVIGGRTQSTPVDGLVAATVTIMLDSYAVSADI